MTEPHGENALLSKLHSKSAMGFVLGVALTSNVMDVETVELLFCTGFPLPSVAEVMVVCVGGCIGVEVAITDTVSSPLFVTYRLPLSGS